MSFILIIRQLEKSTWSSATSYLFIYFIFIFNHVLRVTGKHTKLKGATRYKNQGRGITMCTHDGGNIWSRSLNLILSCELINEYYTKMFYVTPCDLQKQKSFPTANLKKKISIYKCIHLKNCLHYIEKFCFNSIFKCKQIWDNNLLCVL